MPANSRWDLIRRLRVNLSVSVQIPNKHVIIFVMFLQTKQQNKGRIETTNGTNKLPRNL